MPSPCDSRLLWELSKGKDVGKKKSFSEKVSVKYARYLTDTLFQSLKQSCEVVNSHLQMKN